jgi:hypothetical protein
MQLSTLVLNGNLWHRKFPAGTSYFGGNTGFVAGRQEISAHMTKGLKNQYLISISTLMFHGL